MASDGDTVIGRIENIGVVEFPQRLELVEDSPHLRIDVFTAGKVSPLLHCVSSAHRDSPRHLRPLFHRVDRDDHGEMGAWAKVDGERWSKRLRGRKRLRVPMVHGSILLHSSVFRFVDHADG